MGDTRANNVTVGLARRHSRRRLPHLDGRRHHRSHLRRHRLLPPDTAGATYHTVAPGRVLDTRKTGSGHTNIGPSGKFVTKTVRNLQCGRRQGSGLDRRPGSVRRHRGHRQPHRHQRHLLGYVSVGPTVAAVPSTSTINVAMGATVANGVTVALKAGKLQAVWDGTAGSSADVIFDSPAISHRIYGSRVSTRSRPTRLLDTTTGKGLVGLFTSRTSRSLTVGGVEAIPRRCGRYQRQPDSGQPSSNGFAFISPAAVASPRPRRQRRRHQDDRQRLRRAVLGGQPVPHLVRHGRLDFRPATRRNRLLEVAAAVE